MTLINIQIYTNCPRNNLRPDKFIMFTQHDNTGHRISSRNSCAEFHKLWGKKSIAFKTCKIGRLSKISDYKPKMCCGCCELGFQNWTQLKNSNKEKVQHIFLLTTPDSLNYKNILVFAFWNSPGLRYIYWVWLALHQWYWKALYISDICSLHRIF